jgi:hypothetical protein
VRDANKVEVDKLTARSHSVQTMNSKVFTRARSQLRMLFFVL